MTKTWTKEMIADCLTKSNIFLERALLVMYNRQTETEKASDSTAHNNGIGFNGTDANFGCKVAKWIESSNRPEGQRLSDKQRLAMRKMLKKYSGQLLDHANKTASDA